MGTWTLVYSPPLDAPALIAMFGLVLSLVGKMSGAFSGLWALGLGP